MQPPPSQRPATGINQTVPAQAAIGAASLLAANAALLYLYFKYELTLEQLVIVYWIECLWIGVYSALKLLIASIIGNPYENRWFEVSKGANLMLSVVAIAFVSAEFLALFGFLGVAIGWALSELSGVELGDALLEHLGLMFGISFLFLAGHGFSFVVNFLLLGEFRTARVGPLIALPFKRSIALLVCVALAFAAAFYVPGLASKTTFAVLLMLLKLAWDLRLHLKERESLGNHQP